MKQPAKKRDPHLRNVTHMLEMFLDVRRGNPELTDMEALAAAEEFLLQKEGRA